jgi:hypothetical protein
MQLKKFNADVVFTHLHLLAIHYIQRLDVLTCWADGVRAGPHLPPDLVDGHAAQSTVVNVSLRAAMEHRM